MQIHKLIKYILIGCLATLIGCENDDQRRIPNMQVYLELDLNGRFSTFRNQYDVVVYDKKETVKDFIGFGGILVNIDYQNRYGAYDLACPYEVNPLVRVHPNEIGTQAVCPECGSVFEIWNGTGMVSKTPSKWNLKRYQVRVRRDASGDVVIVTR